MRKLALVILVLSVMGLVLVSTAGAQAPTPGIELVANPSAGCVVTLRGTDFGGTDEDPDNTGPLQAYAIQLTYTGSYSLFPTVLSTWFGPVFAVQQSCTGGLCSFDVASIGSAGVGEGDLVQITAVGSGAGTLSFVVQGPTPGPEYPLLSNPDGIAITPLNIGGSIDLETCGPSAIGEPLGFQASSGGSGGALAAFGALGLVALGALVLTRRKDAPAA